MRPPSQSSSSSGLSAREARLTRRALLALAGVAGASISAAALFRANYDGLRQLDWGLAESGLPDSLVNHGGSIQRNPRLQLVLVGDNRWDTDPEQKATAGLVADLLGNLKGSSYLEVLTEYGDSAGRFENTATLENQLRLDVPPGTALSPDQLAAAMSAACRSNGIRNDENVQWVVLLGPGVTIPELGIAQGAAGHDYRVVDGERYVLSMVPWADWLLTPEQRRSTIHGKPYMAQVLANYTAHEVVEAILDPFRNGWYCAGDLGQTSWRYEVVDIADRDLAAPVFINGIGLPQIYSKQHDAFWDGTRFTARPGSSLHHSCARSRRSAPGQGPTGANPAPTALSHGTTSAEGTVSRRQALRALLNL